MRLKEIKPEMVIHCKNDEEKKALLEEAERLGYIWYASKKKPTKKCPSGNTIYFYDADGSTDYKHITHSPFDVDGTIEFSDLIMPELTVEEVLQIRNELSFDFVREYLGLCHGHNSVDEMLRIASVEQILDMCYQWKAEHEKKEPVIETVDICRIIEVLPDGHKRCVHEEDIEPDPDFPFGGNEREKVEEILKCYCMEHEGEFIAAHEVVSRVKK